MRAENQIFSRIWVNMNISNCIRIRAVLSNWNPPRTTKMLFFYFKQLSVCSLLTASFLFHLCLPWMQRLVCQYTVIAEASATKVWPIAQTPPPLPLRCVQNACVQCCTVQAQVCVVYWETLCCIFILFSLDWFVFSRCRPSALHAQQVPSGPGPTHLL